MEEKKLRYNSPAQNRRDKVIVCCKYNKAIDCNRRDIKDDWFCEHCGWNPSEAARRKKEDVKLRILVSEDTVQL